MAIDFRRSFSIREFAAKMRSVDVEKSWPFVRAGDELPKEEKDRMLPPMVCKKYRWWGDELKAARMEKPETERPSKEAPEEDPTVKICPVCGTFTASTMNAVNAHIDSCLSQASKDDRRKAKSRAPKTRSIVEEMVTTTKKKKKRKMVKAVKKREERYMGLDFVVVLPCLSSCYVLCQFVWHMNKVELLNNRYFPKDKVVCQTKFVFESIFS